MLPARQRNKDKVTNWGALTIDGQLTNKPEIGLMDKLAAPTSFKMMEKKEEINSKLRDAKLTLIISPDFFPLAPSH